MTYQEQPGSAMKRWAVQDARARFSELLERCLSDGPQLVTRRGEDVAVLVNLDEWKRLHGTRSPSVKQWLLTGEVRGKLKIPTRRRRRRRPF